MQAKYETMAELLEGTKLKATLAEDTEDGGKKGDPVEVQKDVIVELGEPRDFLVFEKLESGAKGELLYRQDVDTAFRDAMEAMGFGVTGLR